MSPPTTQTAPPADADLGGDELIEACAALGARLARAVRRRRPAQVARLLAEARSLGVDAMLVTLAGMVPAHRAPAELLAWTVDSAVEPPVRAPAPHGSDAGYREHRLNGTPICRPCSIAHSVTSRPKACRDEFARLIAAGVDHQRAALLSTPAFLLAHPRTETAA